MITAIVKQRVPSSRAVNAHWSGIVSSASMKTTRRSCLEINDRNRLIETDSAYLCLQEREEIKLKILAF